MEYCDRGDLKSWLLELRARKEPIQFSQLLTLCVFVGCLLRFVLVRAHCFVRVSHCLAHNAFCLRGAQICSGMQCLQHHGIIHRSVSPFSFCFLALYALSLGHSLARLHLYIFLACFSRHCSLTYASPAETCEQAMYSCSHSEAACMRKWVTLAWHARWMRAHTTSRAKCRCGGRRRCVKESIKHSVLWLSCLLLSRLFSVAF